jgi:hypothetical protein
MSHSKLNLRQERINLLNPEYLIPSEKSEEFKVFFSQAIQADSFTTVLTQDPPKRLRDFRILPQDISGIALCEFDMIPVLPHTIGGIFFTLDKDGVHFKFPRLSMDELNCSKRDYARISKPDFKPKHYWPEMINASARNAATQLVEQRIRNHFLSDKRKQRIRLAMSRINGGQMYETTKHNATLSFFEDSDSEDPTCDYPRPLALVIKKQVIASRVFGNVMWWLFVAHCQNAQRGLHISMNCWRITGQACPTCFEEHRGCYQNQKLVPPTSLNILSKFSIIPLPVSPLFYEYRRALCSKSQVAMGEVCGILHYDGINDIYRDELALVKYVIAPATPPHPHPLLLLSDSERKFAESIPSTGDDRAVDCKIPESPPTVSTSAPMPTLEPMQLTINTVDEPTSPSYTPTSTTNVPGTPHSTHTEPEVPRAPARASSSESRRFTFDEKETQVKRNLLPEFEPFTPVKFTGAIQSFLRIKPYPSLAGVKSESSVAKPRVGVMEKIKQRERTAGDRIRTYSSSAFTIPDSAHVFPWNRYPARNRKSRDFYVPQ